MKDVQIKINLILLIDKSSHQVNIMIDSSLEKTIRNIMGRIITLKSRCSKVTLIEIFRVEIIEKAIILLKITTKENLKQDTNKE
jgi:hypothetical protein